MSWESMIEGPDRLWASKLSEERVAGLRRECGH